MTGASGSQKNLSMSTQEEHSLITLRMSESFLWLRSTTHSSEGGTTPIGFYNEKEGGIIIWTTR